MGAELKDITNKAADILLHEHLQQQVIAQSQTVKELQVIQHGP